MQAETSKAYWLINKAKGVLLDCGWLSLFTKQYAQPQSLYTGWRVVEISEDAFTLAGRMMQLQ